MDKQKIIDFLKILCPIGKVEFNNLDKTLSFDEALNFQGNVYFLASIDNKEKRNSDDDIVFKNYFYVDFDIRENYKKVNGTVLSDTEMEFYLDFIKKNLQDNGYGDYRFIVNTGNGYHFYWIGDGKKFEKEIYKKAVEYHYKKIDLIFNDKVLKIDHACKNIGRIARLPGSYNYSREKKFGLEKQEVIILEDTGKTSNKIKDIDTIAEKIEQEEIIEQINYSIRDITDPQLEAILEMDIVPFVEEYTGLRLSKDKKNFPDKDGNTGMFVANNILFRVGTARISDKFKGYNTFTFIKQHYNLDNHGTFERFRERYPDIKKLKDKPKEILIDDEISIDFENKIPFTWGLDCLDSKFGKYDYGKFNVIVGESQSGKTEFTFFQARENARTHKVLYISLEMMPKDMIIRYSMKKSAINQLEWSNKTITEQQKDIMKHNIKKIQGIKNLKLVGLENPTLSSIIETIKTYYAKGYQLVYIDNLGFIVGEGREIDDTKETSRQLKSLTNNLPITINLIHHFNKGSSKDREKGRGLADIRSSGKIENDADNVLKVERDLSTEEYMDEEMRAEVRVVLLKDRVYGQPSGVRVYFKKGEYVENF